MASAAIDDSDWERVQGILASWDEKRETIIKRCRDSQKLAKQAVYSLHRADMAQADKQLKACEAIMQELMPTLQQHSNLRYGSFAASVEEYVEGVAFQTFLKEGRLLRSSDIPIAEPEEYLGGILDMTGELNRWSIARATSRDKASVQKARDLVDAIMGRFLKFDLRNGALRKKFDGLKYTLKKMENTLYELSLTDALGIARDTSADDAMEQHQAAAGQAEQQE